jgi:TonB family protein
LRVTIRVEVDKRGRATGQVELVPPTPNKKFNRQLMDKARRMQYYPARRDGRPVTGWAEITFVF